MLSITRHGGHPRERDKNEFLFVVFPITADTSKSRILIGVEAHKLLKTPRTAAFQHPLCTRIATSASHAVTSFTVIGHKRPDPNDSRRDGNLLLVVGVCNNIIVIAVALVLIVLQYEQRKGGGTNKLVWERRRQRAVFNLR